MKQGDFSTCIYIQDGVLGQFSVNLVLIHNLGRDVGLEKFHSKLETLISWLIISSFTKKLHCMTYIAANISKLIYTEHSHFV